MGCVCSRHSHTIENSDGDQNFPDSYGLANQDTRSLSDLGNFNDSGIRLSDFIMTEDPVIKGYKLIRELGNGAFSRVFQVKNEHSKEIFAAKIYDSKKLSKRTLTNDDPPLVLVQRELEIMIKYPHIYVINLVDVFNDPITNSLIFIIPFAKLGNVKTMIEQHKLTKAQLRLCFLEIGIGLAYLHENNVVHRDIKPDNILALTYEHFVLSDLSVSQEVKDGEKLYDTKGSPAFLSPEECEGHPFYPKPADVWSFGISLYACIFGVFPFDIGNCIDFSLGNPLNMIKEKLSSNKLTFPKTSDLQLVDLLKRILVKNPQKRLQFSQIIRHSWFDKARQIEMDVRNDLQYSEEESFYDEEDDYSSDPSSDPNY